MDNKPNETPEELSAEVRARLATDEVMIVKRGLLGFAWCCAPKSFTREQVEAALDAQGEKYLPEVRWTVAPREHEDETLRSPGHCSECPDTRQHWFLIGGLSGVALLAMNKDATGFPPDLEIRRD